MKKIFLFVGFGIFCSCSSQKSSEFAQTEVYHIREHRIRIESIETRNGRDFVFIQGQEFEISPFTDLSDAWIAGQRVNLRKNPKFSYYNVIISNLDNEEEVNARKVTEEKSNQSF